MRKIDAIYMGLMKHKKNIIPFLLLIGVFIFVSLYTTTTNIHGDGLLHTYFAREIVESQNLLPHYPHNIMESDSKGIIYMPISYPQLAHVSMSLFYLVGGELALKFISAFFAAIVSLFVYLLFRDISKFIAFSCGLLVIIINSQRFIGLNPLMEPILLFGTISSIYYYHKYFKTFAIKDLVLTALFLGFTASIKQQGMIVCFLIFAHAIATLIYQISEPKKVKVLSFKCITLIFLIFLFVAFGPISEQIIRNGTIDFAPTGSNRIPYFEPKYIINSEAYENLDQWLGPNYWPKYTSLFHIVKTYTLWPLYYNQSVYAVNATNIWIYIPLILIIFGIRYLYVKDKMLLSILLFLFIAEILTTYLVQTPIGAYHVIGLGITSMFIPMGLLTLTNNFAKFNQRRVKIFAAVVLVLLIVPPYVQFVHMPLWGNSGRIDDTTLNGYENLSVFVHESDIPNDSIFLGALFRYYLNRDQIWLNAGGGAKVPLILSTQNESVALFWLNYHNVDYIAIDINQIKRRGVKDYIPPDGLISYIDNSENFTKIYDDAPFKIYKVMGVPNLGYN